MIFVKCRQCMHSWLVQGEPVELQQLLSEPEWAESFPCPTPLCSGRAARAGGLAEAAQHIKVVPIPVEHFYRGIMGLGNGAAVDSVRQLLLTGKIVDVEASGKSDRTIIKSMTFDDGTKMSFGISQLGACIYNIEEVKSEIRTGTNTEGDDQDREEAGRVTKNEHTIRELGSESVIHVRSVATSKPTGAEPLPVVSATGGVPAGDPATSDEPDSDHPHVRV